MGTGVIKPKLRIIWKWVVVGDAGLLNIKSGKAQSMVIYLNDKSYHNKSCAFLLPVSGHQVSSVKLRQRSPDNFTFWLEMYYTIKFLLGRFFFSSDLRKLTEKLWQHRFVFFFSFVCVTITSVFSIYHPSIKLLFLALRSYRDKWISWTHEVL